MCQNAAFSDYTDDWKYACNSKLDKRQIKFNTYSED